ncbi:hypothetical protein DFQ09_109170 [Winogradskyella pacifica]|uniref:Beta-lactamase regulating signal transducer with metallopeptidase domain n=1 Tax=Winogradskyella pacifica TaxID=664642 RepID=A0A3D9LNJ7_9FLAO|nr:hypothetical protein [Winogradskyella pacifica]REE08104.1 hypothetical protein DFQ09_109170 [Winogradskyella pacifica]
MILISKYLVPKGYLGITIFPFMFLKTEDLKRNAVLINHEKIHLKQQLELFILPFYVLYTIEFLCRLIQNKKWDLAYRNISFEREAYRHEKDLDYLKSRPLYNVFKFIRN